MQMAEENIYFEGSETFFADLASGENDDESILNAYWVSER